MRPPFCLSYAEIDYLTGYVLQQAASRSVPVPVRALGSIREMLHLAESALDVHSCIAAQTVDVHSCIAAQTVDVHMCSRTAKH